MKTIYVINGPNLNMLGIREPDKYGTESYESLMERLLAHADNRSYRLVAYQSNHEGDLVDEIQKAYGGRFVGVNAYGHDGRVRRLRR